MKKIILPLVILAGLGIGAYFLFGRKKAIAITEPAIVTPEPLPVIPPMPIIPPTIPTPPLVIPGRPTIYTAPSCPVGQFCIPEGQQHLKMRRIYWQRPGGIWKPKYMNIQGFLKYVPIMGS